MSNELNLTQETEYDDSDAPVTPARPKHQLKLHDYSFTPAAPQPIQQASRLDQKAEAARAEARKAEQAIAELAARKAEAELETVKLRLELAKLSQSSDSKLQQAVQDTRPDERRGEHEQRDGRSAEYLQKRKFCLATVAQLAQDFGTPQTQTEYCEAVQSFINNIARFDDFKGLTEGDYSNAIVAAYAKMKAVAPKQVQNAVSQRLRGADPCPFPRAQVYARLTEGCYVDMEQKYYQMLEDARKTGTVQGVDDLQQKVSNLFHAAQKLDQGRTITELTTTMLRWLPKGWGTVFAKKARAFSSDPSTFHDNLQEYIRENEHILGSQYEVRRKRTQDAKTSKNKGNGGMSAFLDGGTPAQIQQLRQAGTCFKCKDKACKKRAQDCKKKLVPFQKRS
jgi:hypothetical protein